MSIFLGANNHADISFDKEGEPNKCVMKLYEERLETLQANPLGLDRFSWEEKVHIELLLHLLQVLNALILKWAAQANDSGHVFRGVDFQPSRKNVV